VGRYCQAEPEVDHDYVPDSSGFIREAKEWQDSEYIVDRGKIAIGRRTDRVVDGDEGAEFSPMTSYGVAKAGVIQFSRQMALQLAEFNVNVNCICPGVLYTPLYERSAPRRIAVTPGAKE